MKLFHDVDRERHVLGALVDEIQCVAVAGDLLFGVVLGCSRLEDQRLDPPAGRQDPFDPIGRLSAFDACDLSQRLEDRITLSSVDEGNLGQEWGRTRVVTLNWGSDSLVPRTSAF
jgi:hypothetical protein